MANYCLASDVANFLQVDNFSGSTTPTDSVVSTFIDMAEARVNQLTNHAWHTNSAIEVTEERGRIQKVRTNALNSVGRIQLSHYPVLAFTQHATPSLAQTNGNFKVWSSNAYKDYLDTDNSKVMGTVTDVVNEDYRCTSRRRCLYFLQICNTSNSK